MPYSNVFPRLEFCESSSISARYAAETSLSPAYEQEIGIPTAGYVTGSESADSRADGPIDLTEEFQHSSGSASLRSSDDIGSSSLAKAGRAHSTVVVANVRAMVPVVLNHGYPAEDVEDVVEGTIAEVSFGARKEGPAWGQRSAGRNSVELSISCVTRTRNICKESLRCMRGKHSHQ